MSGYMAESQRAAGSDCHGRVQQYPGESVLLVLEDEQEALREVYISELRATNERLQADVKHKQRLLDARGKVLACCRRSLANEQLYREQDRAHYKRLLASSEEQLAFRDRQVQALTTALEAEVASRLKADGDDAIVKET